jgi:hypothetical protein
MAGRLLTQWECIMGEPWNREPLVIPVNCQQPDETEREEPCRPDEFKGYSLELLALLEG